MLEMVNKIYFKKSDYDSIDEMYETLFTQQLALTKNNCMCLVYKSPYDSNIFVLEFASLDPLFNEEKLLPCWITPQEAARIAEGRIERYSDDFANIVRDSLKLDDEEDDDDFNKGGGNHDA